MEKKYSFIKNDRYYSDLSAEKFSKSLASFFDRRGDRASISTSLSADNIAVLSIIIITLLMNEWIENKTGFWTEIIASDYTADLFIISD